MSIKVFRMEINEFFERMMNAKDPTVSSSVFLSVVTTLTILYVWGIVSIWKSAIQDIPTGVWTFAGIVILGKVGTVFADRPSVKGK